MERKKELTSIDWRVYAILKKHVGAENSVTAEAIALVLNLTDSAVVRPIIAKLKKSDIIKRVICANKKGYYLAESEEEAVDYLKRDKMRYLKGLVANYSQAEKLSLHGQARLTFGKYERGFIISLSADLKGKKVFNKEAWYKDSVECGYDETWILFALETWVPRFIGKTKEEMIEEGFEVDDKWFVEEEKK